MLPPYQLLSYGPSDWLLVLDDANLGNTLARWDLSTAPSIAETVIGYSSILLRCTEVLSEQSLRKQIDSHGRVTPPSQCRSHEIRVHYDGPDLDELAQALHIDREKWIELHCAPSYSVRFLGFSPGFAYLDGLDPQLHFPRRATPRPQMAAGAVAIGASHAGIYSIPSPGGWNWIGNTDHPLFHPDLRDASAFTLRPGDTIRFVPSNLP